MFGSKYVRSEGAPPVWVANLDYWGPIPEGAPPGIVSLDYWGPIPEENQVGSNSQPRVLDQAGAPYRLLNQMTNDAMSSAWPSNWFVKVARTEKKSILKRDQQINIYRKHTWQSICRQRGCRSSKEPQQLLRTRVYSCVANRCPLWWASYEIDPFRLSYSKKIFCKNPITFGAHIRSVATGPLCHSSDLLQASNKNNKISKQASILFLMYAVLACQVRPSSQWCINASRCSSCFCEPLGGGKSGRRPGAGWGTIEYMIVCVRSIEREVFICTQVESLESHSGEEIEQTGDFKVHTSHCNMRIQFSSYSHNLDVVWQRLRVILIINPSKVWWAAIDYIYL